MNQIQEPAHFAVWPQRVPREIPPVATTLWHNLEVSARRYPDKAALVFFGQPVSYRQLERDALRIAGWLEREAKVAHGDRVLLMMQNSPQFVIAAYAILRAGAVVVPVNPMSRADELAHYIEDPQARVAIVASDLLTHMEQGNAQLAPEHRLSAVLVGCYADYMPAEPPDAELGPPVWQEWLHTRPSLPSLATDWQQALRCDPPVSPPPQDPDALMALCYTSGTTGKPKGCMHTHRTIGHNTVAGALWHHGHASDLVLGVVPMFHITGMQFAVHAPIWLGATNVVMPRWDRELAGTLISRYRITSWTNIPTMIIDLLGSPNLERFDLSSLQYIGGGGAAMPQAVAERLASQFGLTYAEGYGLTETAAPSHSNPPDAARLQCLGIPFIGTDARIIDPDSLQELPAGSTGEIIIHGPQLFKGYWGRPAESEAAFITMHGKRFLRTGDLGHVDAQGYFYITDRLKRMINASGFKVWPAEVETMLFKHPAVQEACVIATRDPYRGEGVKAMIVLRADARNRDIGADEIIAWARERMSAYKVPQQIEFIDALPKSGSGKVLWRVLQEQELGRASKD
ncbi:MAG: long-chain fatty acid--CoA ligase [Quisquiliibacterium sp.]